MGFKAPLLNGLLKSLFSKLVNHKTFNESLIEWVWFLKRREKLFSLGWCVLTDSFSLFVCVRTPPSLAEENGSLLRAEEEEDVVATVCAAAPLLRLGSRNSVCVCIVKEQRWRSPRA